MPTATAIPVEEYLRTCYEPDAEYVDGCLVERNVGEWSHSLLQGLITTSLGARGGGRFRVFPELRIRVSNEPRYRIPDICVVPLSHPYERVLTRPPHLAIEILSPDDEVPDVLAKVGEYLEMGIPHVWFVDPYHRRVSAADSRGVHERADCVVETDLVGAEDFRSLFAPLDQAIRQGN